MASLRRILYCARCGIVSSAASGAYVWSPWDKPLVCGACRGHLVLAEVIPEHTRPLHPGPVTRKDLAHAEELEDDHLPDPVAPWDPWRGAPGTG